MKKIFAAFLVMAFVCMTICSCGEQNTKSETTNSGSSKTQSVVQDVYPLTDDTYEMKDGIPPLNEDLKVLFTESVDLYYALLYGTSETISLDNESGYAKVLEFKSISELKKAVSKHFTNDYINNNFKDRIDACREYNGEVYVKAKEKISNGYLGHCFEMSDIFDTQITMIAKVFIDDDSNVKSLQYIPNGGMGELEIQNREFCLSKSSSGWQFSKFAELY